MFNPRPNEQEIHDAIEAWLDRRNALPKSEHVAYTTPNFQTALAGEAQILVTRTWLPTCEPVFAVEWFGPANAPVRLPEELCLTRLKGQFEGGVKPERITGLPWSLRLIDHSTLQIPPHLLYVRTDAEAGRLTYPFWRARIGARRAWQWFSIRALMTLGIWGALDFEVNCERRWRDAFGPQRRWLKRCLTGNSRTPK